MVGLHVACVCVCVCVYLTNACIWLGLHKVCAKLSTRKVRLDSVIGYHPVSLNYGELWLKILRVHNINVEMLKEPWNVFDPRCKDGMRIGDDDQEHEFHEWKEWYGDEAEALDWWAEARVPLHQAWDWFPYTFEEYKRWYGPNANVWWEQSKRSCVWVVPAPHVNMFRTWCIRGEADLHTYHGKSASSASASSIVYQ